MTAPGSGSGSGSANGSVSRLVVVDDRCAGCGSCIATCPTGALRPARGHPALVADLCTGCLACVEVCPVDAITPLRSP